MGNIIIIVCLILGMSLGFKKGFFSSLIDFVGGLVVIIISFLLKDTVSSFLYENFPFFDVGGIAILNILIYELIAFLVIYSILMILYRIIVNATSFFEKLLTITVIFGIPSKILGAIVGLFDSFVFIFIALYVLSLPVFNLDIVKESSMAQGILKHTPVLSSLCDSTVKTVEEFNTIRKAYDEDGDIDKANLDALDLFLKYEIIDVESVDKLVEKDKLQISNIESVLKKYRTEITNEQTSK